MGDDTSTKKPYRVQRRKRRKVPVDRSKAVVTLCTETLKEVWIHVDENKLVGQVTFITESNKRIRRHLVYTWFVAGTWTLKIDAENYHTAEPVAAENVDPVLYDRIEKLYKQGVTLFAWIQGEEGDQIIECLLSTAAGKEVPVHVTYLTLPENGETVSGVKPKPLSDDHLDALADPVVASIYLMLLEHFAGLSIDERVAIGGLTPKERDHIFSLTSNNPEMTPRVIARVLTQAWYEWDRVRPQVKGLDGRHLLFMVEAILYQRKRKNALAVHNQLEIARGVLRGMDGAYGMDAGIKQRGPSVMLLYDRFGRAVPAFVGYMDPHYRSVDLDKVPLLVELPVDPSDPFGGLLKVLEQTFSYPNHEIYVFFASYCDFHEFIVEEIYNQYNGEIGDRLVEMLPVAIGFFVVHAVLGYMAARGNPYAAALIVAARAYGWIMDVDMGIASYQKMATAGRHFGQVERIHRRSPKEKGKEELTKLSQYHLEQGAMVLIEAIAELAAWGIFIVGSKLGQKLGGPLAKHVRAKREQARFEFHLDEKGRVTKVRSTKGESQVEVQVVKNETSVGSLDKANAKGVKLKEVDAPPLDETGSHVGRRQQSHRPKPKKITSVLDYKFTMKDGQGRPASSEAVSGMPEAHLKVARETARELGVIALFRVTNPKSVSLIKQGHPPKGKDLIALKTDPQTGKVTAKTPKQRRIAEAEGYYILARDGYAYNLRGQGKFGRRIAASPDGARWNMQEGTHRPGQVIDPRSRKAVVGDYDLQDVIHPKQQTRNFAPVPEKLDGDVYGAFVRPYKEAFNQRLKASGDPYERIAHGADAQFMQYRAFRSKRIKGDAIAVLPDGRVAFLSEAELPAFYKTIGRSPLSLGRRIKLQPYRRGSAAPSSTIRMSRYGDLTASELEKLQRVARKVGRPIWVVGSTAKGTRRGVGSDLPAGKGEGTKSDLDLAIDGQHEIELGGRFSDEIYKEFKKGQDVDRILTNRHRNEPAIQINPDGSVTTIGEVPVREN